MLAIALPFLAGIGAPELMIIAIILSIKCIPVLLVAVAVIVIARSRKKTISAPVSPQVAPGWFPDPLGRHQLRYWDGSAWSSFVSDDGVQSQDSGESEPRGVRGAEPAELPEAPLRKSPLFWILLALGISVGITVITFCVFLSATDSIVALIVRSLQ